MKYNYKCVASKNGKRYYKNVGGKWKRITNKAGEKAEKGKKKYRMKENAEERRKRKDQRRIDHDIDQITMGIQKIGKQPPKKLKPKQLVFVTALLDQFKKKED